MFHHLLKINFYLLHLHDRQMYVYTSTLSRDSHYAGVTFLNRRKKDHTHSIRKTYFHMHALSREQKKQYLCTFNIRMSPLQIMPGR